MPRTGTSSLPTTCFRIFGVIHKSGHHTLTHFKKMEYKYPEGKVLAYDEAKELLRKEMDEQIDALKRKHGMA